MPAATTSHPPQLSETDDTMPRLINHASTFAILCVGLILAGAAAHGAE